MTHEFRTQRLVQFAETDMAGIAHFTNYLRYMEEAEHEYLRSRGLSVVMHDEKGSFGFPKMSARCDFARPVKHEQLLDITVSITADDGKTITYDCEFHCEGTAVAAGQLKVACCRFPGDSPPYPIPIPDSIITALSSQT